MYVDQLHAPSALLKLPSLGPAFAEVVWTCDVMASDCDASCLQYAMRWSKSGLYDVSVLCQSCVVFNCDGVCTIDCDES